MAVPGRCLGHVIVEIGAEVAIVLRKQLGRENVLPSAPKEGCPNIISCLLAIKEVRKHHGAKSLMRFSLYI